MLDRKLPHEAERLLRESHWFDSTGVLGPRSPRANGTGYDRNSSLLATAPGRIFHWTKTVLHWRPIQSPQNGRIIAVPQVGGLHHRYERLAANHWLHKWAAHSLHQQRQSQARARQRGGASFEISFALPGHRCQQCPCRFAQCLGSASTCDPSPAFRKAAHFRLWTRRQGTARSPAYGICAGWACARC